MKILITGNQGYVGPQLATYLRAVYPTATLIGFDIGFFEGQVTSPRPNPEVLLNRQVIGDVRHFPEELLEGVDAVIHLAAISNDPIGNRFEQVTLDINYRATIAIAEAAKRAGVKHFVFASSCSVYGFAEDAARTEHSSLNPLTAYAKSKVYSEEKLEGLASDDFKITCLRFATACGMSERLRLDLVLNDFTAGAIASGEINILSDGTPWRPLINVNDMARAMAWAIERDPKEGGNFLVINTGSNVWNYQVRELAQAIQMLLPEVRISINRDAQPDKRSYRVDFSLFEKLAPQHQPQYDLQRTVNDLIEGLRAVHFQDRSYRSSSLIRLNVLTGLIESGRVNQQLQLVEERISEPKILI